MACFSQEMSEATKNGPDARHGNLLSVSWCEIRVASVNCGKFAQVSNSAAVAKKRHSVSRIPHALHNTELDSFLPNYQGRDENNHRTRRASVILFRRCVLFLTESHR